MVFLRNSLVCAEKESALICEICGRNIRKNSTFAAE